MANRSDKNLMPLLLGGAAVYGAYQYGVSSANRHLTQPKEAAMNPSFYGSLGAASLPGTSEMVQVSDGTGNFMVYSDGAIEVISGYPNAGKVFKPGSAGYDQVVKNLSAVGDNASQIALVLGLPKYQKAMASPEIPTPSSGGALPATNADVLEGNITVPFYQKDWFMPVAVASGAAVLAGLILFWPRS